MSLNFGKELEEPMVFNEVCILHISYYEPLEEDLKEKIRPKKVRYYEGF